ncbi:unnamed protein product [Choristocarpus tenellus]
MAVLYGSCTEPKEDGMTCGAPFGSTSDIHWNSRIDGVSRSDGGEDDEEGDLPRSLHNGGNLRIRQGAGNVHDHQQQFLQPPSPTNSASPLMSPTMLPGEWVAGEYIGKGSFGEVFKAMNCNTGEEFAVKEIGLSASMGESDLVHLTREIEVMRGLIHPNIVRYLGYEVRAEDGTLLIFQEWIPGNSLSSRLRTYGAFSPAMTRRYTRHVLQGLVYLHQNNVVHMDIKCENLLLDKGGVVKVADFGTALWVSEKNVAYESCGAGSGRRGTPLYMPPEVLVMRQFTAKADTWAVGGAVLQMATLRPPWADLKFRSPVQLHHHMLTCQKPPAVPKELPVVLQSFLMRCFAWKPEDRPNAEELLQDPFLETQDVALPPGCDSAMSSGGSNGESWTNIQKRIVADMRRYSELTSSEDHVGVGRAVHRSYRPSHLTQSQSRSSKGHSSDNASYVSGVSGVSGISGSPGISEGPAPWSSTASSLTRAAMGSWAGTSTPTRPPASPSSNASSVGKQSTGRGSTNPYARPRTANARACSTSSGKLPRKPRLDISQHLFSDKTVSSEGLDSVNFSPIGATAVRRRISKHKPVHIRQNLVTSSAHQLLGRYPAPLSTTPLSTGVSSDGDVGAPAVRIRTVPMVEPGLEGDDGEVYIRRKEADRQSTSTLHVDLLALSKGGHTNSSIVGKEVTVEARVSTNADGKPKHYDVEELGKGRGEKEPLHPPEIGVFVGDRDANSRLGIQGVGNAVGGSGRSSPVNGLLVGRGSISSGATTYVSRSDSSSPAPVGDSSCPLILSVAASPLRTSKDSSVEGIDFCCLSTFSNCTNSTSERDTSHLLHDKTSLDRQLISRIAMEGVMTVEVDKEQWRGEREGKGLTVLPAEKQSEFVGVVRTELGVARGRVRANVLSDEPCDAPQGTLKECAPLQLVLPCCAAQTYINCTISPSSSRCHSPHQTCVQGEGQLGGKLAGQSFSPITEPGRLRGQLKCSVGGSAAKACSAGEELLCQQRVGRPKQIVPVAPFCGMVEREGNGTAGGKDVAPSPLLLPQPVLSSVVISSPVMPSPAQQFVGSFKSSVEVDSVGNALPKGCNHTKPGLRAV